VIEVPGFAMFLGELSVGRHFDLNMIRLELADGIFTLWPRVNGRASHSIRQKRTNRGRATAPGSCRFCDVPSFVSIFRILPQLISDVPRAENFASSLYGHVLVNTALAAGIAERLQPVA
jgi:hypothetical protein